MTLDFPSPSPLLVRRDHSCVPSPWPCFGHWPMMRSQDHGFQPSLCSCLPKAFLLHTSWGEPLVYSHARFLLPCSGRCCCRNWAGSRKWQLSVHETHAQLLREQKLYNLMLLPCLSEPCRGWWQNTQRRPRKAKYLLPPPLEHMMHGAAFQGGLSWDSGVQRVSPSWGVGVGGKGGGGPRRVGSCTDMPGSSSQRKWRGAAWGTLAVYRNCGPFLAREVSACGYVALYGSLDASKIKVLNIFMYVNSVFNFKRNFSFLILGKREMEGAVVYRRGSCRLLFTWFISHGSELSSPGT